VARIVLVGLPGVGKSTVGPAVAGALEIDFVDLDAAIAEQVGMPASDILREQGEPAFRALELAVLRTLLEEDIIIATGGGVVVTEACRDLLKREPMVVWLDAEVDVLISRVQAGDRPLLAGDLADRLGQLRSERSSWYREVATKQIDANGSLDEVVEHVLDCVRT